MTDYILLSRSSPTTDFYLECDRNGQSGSGNYTTLRMYLRAVNRGNTSSFSGDPGWQSANIDGIGEIFRYSANPFMPSGYADNQQRWRHGPHDVNVGHAADGTKAAITLRMILNYLGNVNINGTASFSDFPRIPKPPSKPGKPVASEILPQSVRLTWTASTDNGGSSINGYLVRRYDNSSGTGTYVDSFENNLTRVISGLTPGATYSFRVYARNGSYGEYSVASDLLVVTTLAPARIRSGGVYKFAIPYVKENGVWKMALPFIKSGGVWKKSG